MARKQKIKAKGTKAAKAARRAKAKPFGIGAAFRQPLAVAHNCFSSVAGYFK